MFEQWWFKSIGSAKRFCGFFPCLLDYGRFGRKEAIEFFFFVTNLLVWRKLWIQLCGCFLNRLVEGRISKNFIWQILIDHGRQ